MNVEVNFWAVLAAAASSMIVGSIWYARPVFGNLWMKLTKTEMGKGGMAKPLIITAICSLATAYVLAHVAYLSNQFFGNSFFQDAVSTSFWVWLGFTAARIITHDQFENRPTKLTVLNAAHELVTFLVMGVVIGLIGS